MKKKKKENIIFENVLIENFAAEAKCISRIEDKVVFIDGPVAPGDYADLRVTKSKSSFMEATAFNIRPNSEYRTQTICSHFGTCGGCKWQHIDYQTQLTFKHKQVVDALERIAKVELPEIKPIFPSSDTFYYRNKLEYTFSQNRWLTQAQIDSGESFSRNALGFHIPKRYDKILDIDHCYLQPDPSNAIRLALRDFTAANNLDYYEQVRQEKEL